jgi:hydroxymethylbilane synthase
VTRLVRLGTRGSALALWQTEHARQLLAQIRPDLDCEVIVITTTGDTMFDTPLPVIGGKGVFKLELEQALRDGQIDFAVHSLKDLPTETPSGLAIGAILQRANPADVLVSREGHTIGSLPRHARVGTSSSRRAAQLLRARADLEIVDLRGNVGTRLRKALDPSGPYDAIVMARAALERLGELGSVSELISEDTMLPAPGQGAIALQCREEVESLALIAGLKHTPTELETLAERAFLEGLGGGCAVPVAALARWNEEGSLEIKGRVLSLDGARRVEVEAKEWVSGCADLWAAARYVGSRLAVAALSQGAAELLSGAEGGGGS